MADFFYFLVSQRRRDAKKLWCVRYYFPPLRTLRLGGFARPFFLFSRPARGGFFSSRKDPPRRARRRAAKKLWSTPIRNWGNSPLTRGLGGFLLAKTQRNSGPLLQKDA